MVTDTLATDPPLTVTIPIAPVPDPVRVVKLTFWKVPLEYPIPVLVRLRPVFANPIAPRKLSTNPLEVVLSCLISDPTTTFGEVMADDNPIVTFLAKTSIGFVSKLFLALNVLSSGLYNLNVPGCVVNLALRATYFISSSWDASQVEAFCDLNSDPSEGCLLIIIFWISGRFLVEISSSPTREIQTL